MRAGADRGGGILHLRSSVARAPPQPLNGFTLYGLNLRTASARILHSDERPLALRAVDRAPRSRKSSLTLTHPQEAEAVLGGSYDKRYTPSTFVEEMGEKFRVGWYKNDREAVQVFDTLAE